MFDYATVKVIWWLLVGVLLIGFAVMDGHDMGVGTLLPFVGRSDLERRVVINTVGPHWDGNQVWFITGGGAIFAAWPLVYATAFSGFYWAMLVVLWALFFRPVGFDYRSKIQNPTWRATWDWGLFVGGAVPPVIFGVAFGNLLQGVPFRFDDYLVSTYTGTFWQLLNPFALLAGVVSSAMLTMHGGVYLAHRTEGQIQTRAISAAIAAAAYPVLWLLPAFGLLGANGASGLLILRRTGTAFVLSSLSIAGVIGTAGAAMFPFIMPSSSMPNASLTVWDSVSSQMTLTLMFWATVIFMPLIVLYTSWAYRVMRGKVTVEFIRGNEHSAY